MQPRVMPTPEDDFDADLDAATPVRSAEEEAAAKAVAIREALEDMEAGRVVSHEEAMRWLEALSRGERLPPPRPK